VSAESGFEALKLSKRRHCRRPFAPGAGTRRSEVALLVLAVAVAAPAPAPAQHKDDDVPGWRAGGDFRFRLEADRDRRNDADDRQQARLRMRLWGEVDVVEGLTVGTRIVTANPGDPNSTHVTIGDGFDDVKVAFDRAFVRYRVPTEWRFDLTAGKFAPQFMHISIYNELIWDNDIQPEGLQTVLEPASWIRLLGGYYAVVNQSSGKDTGLGEFQAVATGGTGELVIRGAFGARLYGEFDQTGATREARFNQGNALIVDPATGDTINFASEFQIWNAWADFAYDGWSVPVTVAGEYWTNGEADEVFEDDGWSAGAAVGGLGAPGKWRAAYQYQQVGRESVFSPDAQDDFLDATNFDGHLASLAWEFVKGANVRFWALWSKRREPPEDTWQKRFRLDFNFKWRF
jgi:hypothetical protein